MEAYAKAPSAKRFVIENSITKVTSDGEPHELMTMVAGLSGLLAAVVILAVLVSMVGCRKSKSTLAKKATASVSYVVEQSPRDDSIISSDSSALTMTLTTMREPDSPTSSSASTSRSKRLTGNLNAAFVDSELNLCGDTLRSSNSSAGSGGHAAGCKGKHGLQKNWQASVTAERPRRETYIQVERY